MTNNLLMTIQKNGVAILTLNRPDVHNAFDDRLIEDLTIALKKLETDPNIKIIILAANGKSFSAGADLNWMKKMAEYTYEQNFADATLLATLMKTLKYLAKPTIARVQGAVLGGGVGLVACCDIIVASIDAIFALSEVKLGLIPAIISPYVLSMIGERAARRYFLTGEKMTAEKACELGLITTVVSPEKLDEAIQEIVHELMENSPAAVIAAKNLINQIMHHPYAEAHLKHTTEIIASMRISKEGQEGMNAFLQKRKPRWNIP